MLPPWATEFLRPSRYKVAFGGRGSGKSWAMARLLLMRGAHRKIRILCARELQVSIRDSVHRLLADQVDALGMRAVYDVGKRYISGINGTEFIFKGLRHNAGEIKSMEDIGICWVEEAQGVSEDSWRLLIPTVRNTGSEIWISFNPDQETDPTYSRFVKNPPPDTVSRMVNWQDNPWFSSELDAERQWMLRTDPDSYSWVWGGQCRTVTDAQVLRGKYRVDPFEPGGEWDGPYYGADWGFAEDPTALVRMWVHSRRLYIEHEAWGVGVEIDHLPALFDRVPGSREHTIRADSARPETISYMARNGFRVVPAIKWSGSVEDGVAHLRGYEEIIIHPRCVHAHDEARLWSYKTDRITGDILPALKQGNDHVFDACRYGIEPMIRRGLYGPIEFSSTSNDAAPFGAGAW